MKFLNYSVPIQYRYLSQWKELLDLLPDTGKFILNKEKTGCGGTTTFLDSNQPCILVSPRSNMLYSKAGQYPNAHLFRTRNDTSTSPVRLKERLRDYINGCIHFTPGGISKTIPKILVTIDSYPYVAEQLLFMGLLQNFTVVVDEFQCLMSDSKFKGKTEIEFLHNLHGIKNVCYLSATPIDESYIQNLPDFADVDYYIKLDWDPSVLESPNLSMQQYKAKESSKSICKDIITRYRADGYFAQKIVDGQVVSSKEVVIFLNDVRTIVQIIEDNHLKPDEVNVLCSASNKYIKDLKRLGVHIGELCTDKNNPVNRTFTFASRANFEGVDLYSNQAFTYIFSDGVLDWNRNDLLIDVPQILGRQRLSTNPFRKDAILYYRANSKTDSNAIVERIKAKDAETDKWIAKFNTSDAETKRMLMDGIRKRSDKTRYADDYLEVVDDSINGGYLVRKNHLVIATELRDWQLSTYVYSNAMSIIKTVVGDTKINVISDHGFITQGGCPALDRFKKEFFKASNFPEQMRIYCDTRDKHPELTNELYQNTFIPMYYHQYYDTLGSARIRTLGYRKKDVADASAYVIQKNMVQAECRTVFVVGQRYRFPDVKTQLQLIYNSLGIRATAKANDLEGLMDVQKQQLTTQQTGKRELYYLILS